MAFVVGLPKTKKGYNSIWVIVDRLTKSAHFLPVKTTYNMKKYAKLYVAEIVKLSRSSVIHCILIATWNLPPHFGKAYIRPWVHN